MKLKIFIVAVWFVLAGCKDHGGHPPTANAQSQTYGYEWVLDKDSDEDKTQYDCFNTTDGGWEGKVITGKKETNYFNAYFTTYDSFGSKHDEYATFKDLPSAESYVIKKAEERKHGKSN